MTVNPKAFSETVFDMLNDNATDDEISVFRDHFYTEWNGDQASIDFYPNVDNPHGTDPSYRLLCMPGNRPHPVIQWVQWCSNYPIDITSWIGKVFPDNPSHFLDKLTGLLMHYNPDEAMNRFLRELSDHNRLRLINYIINEFSC